MKLPCNFYSALLDEFQKLAMISPSQQLFSASRIGRSVPTLTAQRPPMPNLGNLGKLPNASQTNTGANVAARTRMNGQAPNTPSVPSMKPMKVF